MLLLANVSSEYGKFWDFYWANTEYRLPPTSIFLLILGSFIGTGIGYSSWWCREMVSATSFTLIGGMLMNMGRRNVWVVMLTTFFCFIVMNKCLTILLNVMIWDQHAPAGGILCLFVCIAGGMIYKQAPMRADQKQISTGITADDEEFKAEISPNVHGKDEDMEMEPL
ncbi:MAG: hypothetical protein SGARI_005404, partial [Bacillariaceae sp.]